MSGKQVVFLFMAGAVALIGTFLLGVSVGRHVEPDPAAPQAVQTPTEAAIDPSPGAPLPPPTTPVPGAMGFTNELRDKPAAPATGGAPASATPSPTPATPPAAQAPKPTPSPVATPKPAPDAAGDWFVQVNSFGTRENAVKQQNELKSKNVASTISVATGKTPYRVRVGPFDHTAAETMKARLEKLGYKPRVTR